MLAVVNIVQTLTLTAAALLFAALGDPTRLALLQRLSDGGRRGRG